MRCPVCGAKLFDKQICPYCKITADQIEEASNKKVKEYIASDNKDLICYTTTIPKDVSRLKLLLFTIFLGLLGVNHLYVYKRVRGWYSIISTALSFLLLILKTSISFLNKSIFFEIIYELAFFAMAINVLLWVFDIFDVIFKRFKIPVVLKEKE